MASTSPLADFMSKAASHFSDARPFLPMYIHLILSALFPIYTGAHASLSRPSSAAKPNKEDEKEIDTESDDEDDDSVQNMEGMSNKDAIVLPITAAMVLGGLYFAITRWGAGMINLILGWYFSGVGVFSVTKLINDGVNVLISFVFPAHYALKASLWSVRSNERNVVRLNNDKQTKDTPLPPFMNAFPIPRSLKTGLWDLRRNLKQKYTIKAYIDTVVDLKANVTTVNVFSAFLGLATILYVNTMSKPWFLTNLQGFAVSYSALQMLSPTTFATGSLILGALFFYDIWAVFFTPLMVTVAKNLDQPIKLVFPRPDEPSAIPGEPPIKTFSMLGLGDVVLPGIMIGLALRFDLYNYYLKQQKTASKKVINASGHTTITPTAEKAPYVSATGHWGDRFWTSTLPVSSLPSQLRFSFPKPYFTATVIGYVIGMLTTLSVMSVFQHAQPALLYLVPGVLISLWATAVVRGELKQVWDFSEAVTGDQFVEDRDEKNKGESEVDGEVEKKAKGLFERLWQELWSGSETIKQAKLAERETDNSANSKKSNKSDKDNTEFDQNKAPTDHVIVSFSIVRYNRQVANPAKDVRPSSRFDKEHTPSPSRSESSEEAVLVSQTDVDGTKDSNDSAPRYRTRSRGARPA